MFFHENLYDAIKSVLSQNYKEWELLIGYKSNNENIHNVINTLNIQNYNVKIFELEDNLNLTKIDILNLLKQKSVYPWIAIKDISDCWLYDKLMQQMFIVSGNEYSIIGTNYMLDDSKLKMGKNIPLRHFVNEYNFLDNNPIINQSVLIKKELCNWTNNWLYNEEYELFIKLWMKGYKFYNLTNPYIKVIIDVYLQDITPNKNKYKKLMIDSYSYRILNQFGGNKPTNSSRLLL
jgi:hypothetical protein